MVGRKRVGDLELAASPTFLSCQMTLDGEKPWAMGIGPWPAVLPCCVADWRIAAAALRHGTCRANRPPHWQPRLLSSAQLRQTGLIVGSLISET